MSVAAAAAVPDADRVLGYGAPQPHSVNSNDRINVHCSVGAVATIREPEPIMAEEKQDHGIGEFLRSFTGGVDLRKAHRTLGRDAGLAFQILTREHADRPEPAGRAGRLWHRTRILFLGLSSKLAPTRRVLFAACIVVALLSLQHCDAQVAGRSLSIGGGSPLMVLAFAGLVLLLVLELADRVVIRDEIEVARQLQRALLPDRPPTIDGYSSAFSYATANTIGGDYYDFLSVPDGRTAVVIGDASGHGMAAGILMAIANAALKLAIDVDPNPTAVAELMNRVLYRTGGSRDFMTMFYGVLDPRDGRLEYICVGHPYPLIRRASGQLSQLGSASLPLGIRSSIEPTPGITTLSPGDLLVMVTDGIPEAVDAGGETFGFERLESLVADGGTADEVHRRIGSALSRFTSGTTPHDDWSLVAIRRDR